MLSSLLHAWRGIDGWIRWTLTLLGAPLVIVGVTYWGYCWGWWGRNTLALQYLFQCRCPAASEAVRYRPFTVLVSACRQPDFKALAPNGQWLVVETQHPVPRMEVIDVRQPTVARALPITVPSWIYFLDDSTLLVQEGDVRSYLFDLRDGVRTELRQQTMDVQDAINQGLFMNAERVILLHQFIIILGQNYKNDSTTNTLVYNNSRSPDEIAQELSSAGLRYQTALPPYGPNSFSDRRYSRDSAFYAGSDGLYRASNQQPIVTVSFPPIHSYAAYQPVGWAADDRGAVYMARLAHLIDQRDSMVLNLQYFPVPQPILLLEVPLVYRDASRSGRP
jgi:hypothetical protein